MPEPQGYQKYVRTGKPLAGIMLAARYLFGKTEQEVFADIPSCGMDKY